MVDGFKCIMVPIDFSTHCDQAAEYASWFVQISKAAIHVVHVIANPADAVYEPEEVPNWDMVDHAEKKARQMIEAFARRCVKAHVSPEIHVLHGDPYQKLMEAAREIHPDLIVMSTRGRGSVAHLVIGSVTEKIVRHAPCPVFVAHGEAE